MASLGGNQVAIVDDDLNLAFHNPALLRSGSDNQLVINYVNYFTDIQFGYVSYSKSFNKFGNVALGLHTISYGDFTATDIYGNKTGTFTAKENAINIIYSYQIDTTLTVGINVKPIFSTLEHYTSRGLATDLGIAYYNSKLLLAASLVLKNVGAQIKPYYSDHSEPIPFDLQLGISKRLAHAPFRFSLTAHHLQTFDLTYQKPEIQQTSSVFSDNTEQQSKFEKFNDKIMRHVILGVEFLPFKSFYFNAGFNYQRRKELLIESKTGFVGYSWGFGLRISRFSIGYGRASYHLAGASNHFSFTINLGNLYRKKAEQK